MSEFKSEREKINIKDLSVTAQFPQEENGSHIWNWFKYNNLQIFMAENVS